MPVPQGLPSLSPMGEEFPLFWSLDMMRLGSSVFFCFFGRVKFGVHISARVNFVSEFQSKFHWQFESTVTLLVTVSYC